MRQRLPKPDKERAKRLRLCALARMTRASSPALARVKQFPRRPYRNDASQKRGASTAHSTAIEKETAPVAGAVFSIHPRARPATPQRPSARRATSTPGQRSMPVDSMMAFVIRHTSRWLKQRRRLQMPQNTVPASRPRPAVDALQEAGMMS